MVEKLPPFEAAQHLISEQAIADFLEAARKTDDETYIAHAYSVVARAKAIWQRNEQNAINDQLGDMSE